MRGGDISSSKKASDEIKKKYVSSPDEKYLMGPGREGHTPKQVSVLDINTKQGFFPHLYVMHQEQKIWKVG